MGGNFVLYILLDPTVSGSIDTKVINSPYTPGVSPPRCTEVSTGIFALHPWDPI